MTRKPTALDFFAGSGLVTEGLRGQFDVLWANDICPKKQRVYSANFGDSALDGRSITDVPGRELPAAQLAWGSFPCQDLSLAGGMKGLAKGTRSALYFEWLRVLDEMPDSARPPVLCVENVVGFLVAHASDTFRTAYNALRERGYRAGALVADAAPFVPQSRPRCFLIALREDIPTDGFADRTHNPRLHPASVLNASCAVNDPEWIWWKLPAPPVRRARLSQLIDPDAPADSPGKTATLMDMLSDRNRRKLEEALNGKGLTVGAGYKRVRREGGEKVQRLELRFDGLAGCLRTPNGGSSRQIVVLAKHGEIRTRLLTVRETARLMGVRDSFLIPGSYNDGYRAMGDAVAVPVTRWLARHLLAPLARHAASFAGKGMEVKSAG